MPEVPAALHVFAGSPERDPAFRDALHSAGSSARDPAETEILWVNLNPAETNAQRFGYVIARKAAPFGTAS